MLAFASSSLAVFPLSLLATVLATASPASAQNPIRTQFQRSLTTTASDVDGKTFDFVIAGGGTAGLALAARLSEWSNQTVCVIEAGSTGSDVTDQINIPGYSYLNGLTGTAQDWKYKTIPQGDANNTVKSWPRGKVLGGSGSTNGMFWVRGSTEEYDAWNTLNTDTGTEDWGGEQMMKYINKAETFTMPRDDQIKTFGMVANASVHGSSGPIQASYCAYIYNGVKNWIPAWTALGFPNIDGHSGKKRGVTITPSIINPANSSRSNSLAGYIVPVEYRPNLVILTGYQVTKVNWNSTTQGEAVAGGLAFSAGNGQTVYNVKAAREVILSGGTVGSPQLLQLSGVGPAKTLNGLGITVVSDLPVGYNVQDHISVAVSYNVASGIEVWGELLNSATAAAALTKYKASDYDNSQWSYVNEAIGYPSMADIDSDYATYASTATAALNDNIASITEWQTLPANVAAGLKAQYAITNNWLSNDVGQLEIILTMLSGASGAGIQAALQHPYSRGTILINSTNAFDYPAIDPGYFGMGYDIDILNKGVEFARKLGGTAPLSDMLLSETTPGTTYTGDVLNNWIRINSGTEYHPLGSCSMLPQASGGVVDTRLLVYGTRNLRVVDASIIPLQLSAHLMATAYGIAEKGADIIKAANAAVIKTASSSVVGASSTKAASKVSASASPSGGISAGVVSDATSSGMSTSTRNTVIGVVVGVAGAALVGIIAFILARRRRAEQQRAAARSYYASSPEDDAWDSGYAKESTAAGAVAGGGSYAMAPSHSTSDLGLPPPPTVLPAHSRSMSVASYDTAEMSGAAPMEDSTGGWYQPNMGTPYQDDHSPGMSRSPSPAAQSPLFPDSNVLRPQHYHQ